MTAATTQFAGWPADATAFLAEIAATNTAEFWAANRQRHADAVDAPTHALAVALQAEFGPPRVFRPYVNRRFRPGADPYRTDAGLAVATGGGAVLSAVLSAAALTVAAGHWEFDAGQLRRYRTAVDGEPGAELERVLTGLEAGLAVVPGHVLTGSPRGIRPDHPRIGLLRHRGLQVGAVWPAGPWLRTPEPLDRVRAAWRAARPLVTWLDAHVGAPAAR